MDPGDTMVAKDRKGRKGVAGNYAGWSASAHMNSSKRYICVHTLVT